MIQRRCFLLALCLFLSGCGFLGDIEQTQLCRAILPILYAADTEIDIEAQEASPGSVTFFYSTQGKATGLNAGFGRHSLICRFGDLKTNRRLKLEAAEADGRALKDTQLFFLNTFAFNDPSFPQLAPALTKTELKGLPLLSPLVGTLLQQLVSQAPIPVIYALLGAAYALIYGLIGRINLAFAPFIALGGIGTGIGYLMIMSLDSSAVFAAIAVGLVIALGLGASWGEAIARSVFGPLTKRPGQHVLVATAGLLIAMQEFLRLVQGEKAVWLPSWSSGPLALARTENFIVTASLSSIVVVIIGLVPCFILILVMRKSRFGRNWRAVSDDAKAASLVGVSADATLTTAFIIAGTLCALAGFLVTLHYGGLSYADGPSFAIKALAGAIIGGIGSVGGAVAGAALVGITEALWSSSMAIADRDIAIFTLLVLFLTLKPGGLFGWREGRPRDV